MFEENESLGWTAAMGDRRPPGYFSLKQLLQFCAMNSGMNVMKVKGLRVKLCTLLHCVHHVQGCSLIRGSRWLMISNLIHLDGIKSSLYSGIIFLVCSDFNPVIMLLYVAGYILISREVSKWNVHPLVGRMGIDRLFHCISSFSALCVKVSSQISKVVKY